MKPRIQKGDWHPINKSFITRGYQEQHLKEQFSRASNISRQQQLQYKTKPCNNSQLPFITTFNKTLPHIKTAIDKTWNLLKINKDIASAFEAKPIVAYRRNQNLRDLIGQTTIQNNSVVRKKKLNNGRCKPCHTKTGNSCCKQVNNTSFKSNQTQRSFNILHNTSCRSNFCIYLMECKKCKIQYIGKSETTFNLRLNNHRSDAYNPNSHTIPACKHFSDNTHDFNRDARFTIIEQIKDATKTSEQKHIILLKRENFWMKKLKTLKPQGLNQGLNKQVNNI